MVACLIHCDKSRPMFHKPKRYRNESNLDLIRAMPCAVCGATPSDPDHLKTVGAGGGDELSNLTPLCRRHHTERHAIGVKTFYDKYGDKIRVFRETQSLPEH